MNLTSRRAICLVAVLCAATATAGPVIEMDHCATIPAARKILTEHAGIDLDRNGAREFVITREPEYRMLEVYESAGDSAFGVVHVLALDSPWLPAIHVGKTTGDGDRDGLAELFTTARTGNGGSDYLIRLFESAASGAYPTEVVWELDHWSTSAWIRDTDNDGIPEIVTAGWHYADSGMVSEKAFVVYENNGDNSFEQTHHEVIPFGFLQSSELANDLDEDGWDEILVATVSRVLMYEAVGDNAYAQTWTGDLFYTDGQPVNANTLLDGGDLDGDGRRELLVGGLKTVAHLGDPTFVVLFLFEATGNDAFEVVATFFAPTGPDATESAAVADVDGDGRREIVIGSGTEVSIYRSTADDTWEEIWHTHEAYFANRIMGAGDHDGDGKAEILFRNSEFTTGIYEIHPDYAADQDADGVVDAIDNCPAAGNAEQGDADADSVGDACDNCVQGPNPDQGPAVLGQTIVALDAQTFGWTTAVPVVFVRGGLHEVGEYGVDWVEVAGTSLFLTDATLPGPGAGFYYLVRPDCPVGSWQTALGGEPARDSGLP